MACAAALVWLTSSCTLEHRAAQARICKTTDLAGWAASGAGSTDVRIDAGDSTYFFEVYDTGSKDDIGGAVTPAYWVQLTGLTLGAALPGKRRPMLYDPASAVIVIDGKAVHAIPRIWVGDLVDGRFQPVREMPVPADLDIHYPQGVVANFFIAFPMHAPDVKDTWTFQPGSILLDGKRTPLPTYATCYTEARTWWQPIH